jgi:hypothetical protein
MYKEKIVNIQTGEETFRDFTDEEVSVIEANQTKAAEETAEEAARLSAKLAIYAKLGLTEEEINTLIS